MDQCGTGQTPAIRGVLATFGELHGAESRSARAELEQLDALIADAVARLSVSFERLSALASRAATHVPPREAANDAPEVGPAPACGCAAFDEATSALGEAVTALQFHDIASQLLGHAAARLRALERMAGVLTRVPDSSEEDLCAALAVARGARRANPVSQGRMVEGGIELFQA